MSTHILDYFRARSAHPGDAPPVGRPPRFHVGPPGPPFRRTVALVLAAAVLGAGLTTGVLYATGAAGGTTRVTSVVAQAPVPSGSAPAAFNPTAIYQSTAAGVVAITATSANQGSTGLPFGPASQSQNVATGTGVLIDSNGNLLTAAHVISGASSVTVKLQDGTTRSASVLGVDNSTDLAVLKINPSGLTLHPLTLGNSKSLAVGAPLAVIGDPFGYNRSLSTGVVSATDRTIQAPSGFTVAHAIQTDAAVNPGNSGGPALNAQGQVVGIVDQIATGGNSSSSTGVGFAIPVDVVQAELSQLLAGQHVTHPYLGVSTSQASSQQGALVAGVASGGPAAAAGVRAGDVITAINGSAITGGSSQVVSDIAALKAGDKVTITVQRGSSTLKLTPTLGTQPSRAGTA